MSGWRLRLPLPDCGHIRRLERFRAGHPEWQIGYDGGLEFWQALRPEPGGETVVTRCLLGDLLDRLDSVAGPGG